MIIDRHKCDRKVCGEEFGPGGGTTLYFAIGYEEPAVSHTSDLCNRCLYLLPTLLIEWMKTFTTSPDGTFRHTLQYAVTKQAAEWAGARKA